MREKRRDSSPSYGHKLRSHLQYISLFNYALTTRISNATCVREGLLTFLFKCEVFREMTALVVTSEEEECGGMAQFQRPQVQYALKQKYKNGGR